MTATSGVNGGPQPRLRVVPEAPPHDLIVEREVLYSCIHYPDLLDGPASLIVADDFYASANAVIFGVLRSMRRNGVAISEPTLRSELLDRDLHAQIGGDDYLMNSLTAGLPLSSPQISRLRRLGATRRTAQAAHNLALALVQGEGVDDAQAALDRARKQLADVDAPPERPLDRVWKTLGQRQMLQTAPAPRRWLLTRPNDLRDDLPPIGVLQRGKVGFLVAEGGAGKSIVLIQLALSVATGRRWLDHFGCAQPGRVLIALAEEDEDETHRRFHALARAMRLTDAQVVQADANIVVLPLSGVSARFLDAQGTRTAFLEDLRRRLTDGQGPWSLVVLDPLSRFAGADTEKDNAAATLFVEAAESLLSAPGNPSVLIAHHTNKLSRAEGPALAAKAGNARGASALTDGARWACELQTRGDDGARLTVTKSNYSPLGAAIDLVRDGDQAGYLRIASPAEIAHQRELRDQAAADAAQAEDRSLEARVLRALTDAPGLSKGELQKRCHANRQAVARTVDALLNDRRIIVSAKDAYAVAPAPGEQGELL